MSHRQESSVSVLDICELKSKFIDLIGAMAKIKEECTSHSMCKFCPMHNVYGKGCWIDDIFPEYWDIKELIKEIKSNDKD